MDKNYSYEKDLDKDNNVTLKVKVVPSKFVEVKEKMFNKLSKNVTLTGFRPGKGPRSLMEARLGPDLFEKSLNELLPEITLDIFKTENFEPISQVKYEIQKVSDDEGVEYHAHFVVYPKIQLGNFKKIKIAEEKVEVKREEIEAEKKRIMDIYNSQEEKKSKDKGTFKKITELSDELILDLKIGAKTVAELEKQISDQIMYEKENLKEDKKLKQIVDEAIRLSKIEAPKLLVAEDIKRREMDYTARIEQLGLKIDDFLKAQKTSMDDLKKNWEKESQDKVATELLLYEIVRSEKMNVTPEEVNAEIEKITDEKLRKDYDSATGRRTISTILLQQKALNWLKGQLPK